MESLGNKLITHIGNGLSLGENFVNLKRKLEELNAIKEDNESIKSVELRPRKRLKKEVEIWFENVDRINGEIRNLETQVQGSNVLWRGSLGEKVLKKMEDVDGLVRQSQSFDGLVIDEPQWIGQVLRTTKLFGGAAETCMKEIWAYLMDDGVSKIGVWGMGGVGKTTIMKLIHNQLVKEIGKFNIVIWATMSKETNAFKLQKTIGRAMNASLSEEEDETVRAGKICEMLTQKGKYVLILDDLWEEQFSLEEVGIPEPCNGSKLLVTTRLSNVCQNLGCREVKVPTLSKADAWGLFLEKVGQIDLNSPNLLPIVESVAEECGGLPLAIVTIASSMRGVLDIHEWRNALHELKRNVRSVGGMEEKVFQRLQFSYDRLRDEKVKHCFLCCALYPEDWEITTDELINLWIAEGLVEEMESTQAEIDKGLTILNKLKNSCLVESGTIYKYHVKLHDVVRDMALRIASESGRPHFLVRAGMHLRVIPDVPEWNEDLETVSLMENWGLQIPPKMRPPHCQKLPTLLLSNCYIRSIPECFFEHMRGLKTLDLSGNEMKSLPSSISTLENLTTLLLRGCRDLEEVPSFSKLLALKKLDLLHTKIRDLPDGMEMLVNLRYLRFGQFEPFGQFRQNAADGTFLKLTHLRHLTMDRLLKAEEISGLRELEYLACRFYDLNAFTVYVKSFLAKKKLPSKYFISVGRGGGEMYADFNGSRAFIKFIGGKIYSGGINILSNVESLKIIDCSVDKLCEEKAFLPWFVPAPHDKFSSLSSIYIKRCKGIKKLFLFTWVLQNFQNLRSLRVEGCEETEEIIASESELEEEGTSAIKLITLPTFESLVLKDLPELKSICSANGVMLCNSLKMIEIVNCSKLKNLSPLQNLQNLHSLRVEGCEEMEEILASESELEEEGTGAIKSITLPKLKRLELKNLPELKRICSANGVMLCNSLEMIEIVNCSKLKNLSPLQNLQNLHSLRVEGCEEMEEILASESELVEEGTGAIKSITLPTFRSLVLKNLPELKSICSANGVMLCNSVKMIEIVNCSKLKNLLPLQNLQNLHSLRVEGCEEMEEILASESELEEEGTSAIKLITLPTFRSLVLKNLPELKSICSANGVMFCNSLGLIVIVNCPKLKNLSLLQNLQNLRSLRVEGCEEMEEIIASESELEEEGTGAIKSITLSTFWSLVLKNLPELKSICSANGVIVCNYIRYITIWNCPKLKRIPLHLPRSDDGQPILFSKLRDITVDSREQWKRMEWDHPNAKSLLEPCVRDLEGRRMRDDLFGRN